MSIAIALTKEEATALHAALMQLPNSSNTFAVLAKLVAAANATSETEEVELS